MFNKYYQDELSYLREMGKEFSLKYPAIAPHLAGKGNDPDVERLLEGFSFLTAQIRQKLEDELPELTHSLINLLFPHYVRPTPSMSILQFDANLQRIRTRQRIEPSVEVESKPVGGQRCSFRTCYATTIYPITVKEAVYLASPVPLLKLSFQTADNISLNQLDMKKIRFYLHGEAQWELYLSLSNYLKGVRVESETGGFELSPDDLKPVGFAQGEEALTNYPDNAFSGYRLLQEFFAFPEKFLFFELANLDGLKDLGEGRSFEILLELARGPKLAEKITEKNFLLHCTPVINLFSLAADPVTLDHKQVEYRVRPGGEGRYEIYSIDRVTGYVQGSEQSKVYHPFDSFAWDPERSDRTASYYNLRVKPSLTDPGVNHFLSFVTTGSGPLPSPETISIELTCTNRDLPRFIKINEITNATGSSPEFTRFRNITKPTKPVSPPIFDDNRLFFNLISHLSINYKTVTDRENLRKILEIYNFPALTDQQEARAHHLRLQGIKEVASEPVTRLFKGAPVRGIKTLIKLQEENFASQGELYLFSSVLNRFLSEYVSINSFSQLTVEGIAHGEIYQWPPRTGQRNLI